MLINQKPLFTHALINFLKEKKRSGELAIVNPERSAAYFIGLLKEYHFWPMMVGFTRKKKLSNSDALIKEAISVFLKAYDLK